MQTILNQDAIDTLFDAKTEPVAKTTEATSLYNFGRAGQISNDQMRAISLVNDYFVRNAMHTLGAWLRTQTSVVLVSNEQMQYGEFLSRIPDPAYVCLLKLEPIGGVGLLEIDLKLALTMIDLLLGGRGGSDDARDLTDIEDAILVSVMEVIVRELNAAWEKVGLQFLYDGRDTEGRVPRLMPGLERTLCVSFEVQMLGVQGTLNVCLPAVVLNTIHRRLLAMNEEPKPVFAATAGRIAALMGGAKFPLALRFPPVRLSSRGMRTLEVGTVLELPIPKNTQPELLLGGVRLCQAAAVGRGGQRGALIGGMDAMARVQTQRDEMNEAPELQGSMVGESL